MFIVIQGGSQVFSVKLSCQTGDIIYNYLHIHYYTNSFFSFEEVLLILFC